MKIVVLRLGHRPLRDKRVTTHVALAARAFGADGIVVSEEDKNVEASVKDVAKRWGGKFFIKTASWERYINSWKGIVVHLTMYGMPLDSVIEEIRKTKKSVLIVVGSEKVPGKLFGIADYNVAVGNQPHSEVSAVSTFLDRLFMGKELRREFKGELRIIPSKNSKKVQRL